MDLAPSVEVLQSIKRGNIGLGCTDNGRQVRVNIEHGAAAAEPGGDRGPKDGPLVLLQTRLLLAPTLPACACLLTCSLGAIQGKVEARIH